MLSTFTLLLAGALATMPVPTPAAVHVMKVTARDYAFEAPDTVLAGRTEIRLSNRGKELHHVWLVRLEGGKTAADFFAAMQKGGPQPAWAKDAGGPNSPVPGGESAAVVDLQAGNYVLACVIPSPDGKPHIMKGMAKPLTVVAKKNTPVRTSAAAAPDVKVTLSDYDFKLSRPLTAGHHVVRITNTASQAHELFFARLAPGKTTQDALAWIEKMQGPPPLQPLGGIAGLGTGQSNDFAVDLTPGEYGLFCFIPDAKDGKPHVAHGMVKKITVR
jgi:uncharacterized cupredoxin-like copper-binding protein